MGFWDDKKPKPENFASEEDIKEIKKQLAGLEKTTEPLKGKSNTGKQVMKALARGFGDIAESMNEPDSKRRPKIARMMSGKPPIARMRIENPIAGSKAGIKRHRIANTD